jgi:hypothetical protein
MTRLLLCMCVFMISTAAVAQEELLDESRMVGFACFYEGRETKLVIKFRKMLERKRYASIARQLRSEDPGNRVMAVLCLERLEEINRRTITSEEKVLINGIKASTELVPVCSGCFPSPGVPIREVFLTEILWSAKPWLERHVKQ